MSEIINSIILDHNEVELNKNVTSHPTWKNIKFSSKNSLKILQLNARSVNKKIDEIKYINQKINFADLICVSETWLNKDKEKHTKLTNYTPIYASRSKTTGGGSAVYIKDSLKYETIECFCDESNSFVHILVKLKHKNIDVLSIYRPPYTNSNSIESFFAKLDEKISKINGSAVITGDFNFDLIKKCARTSQYIDIIESNGFHFIFNDIKTRAISGSCLDHVIVNDSSMKYDIHIMPYDLFDHKIILTEISAKKMLIEIDPEQRKTWSYIDKKKFSELVKNEKIRYDSTKSIEKNYKEFLDIINEAKETSSKIKKYPSSKLKDLKPWFDDEVIHAIEMKQRFSNMKTKNPINNNDLFIIAQYKYWRNRTTELKRQKKLKFNKRRFFQTKNDPSKQWKWVKNVINDWESCENRCPLLDDCENDEQNDEKVNEINKYFCTIGNELASKFPTSRPHKIDIENIFDFNYTNRDEVLNVIRSSKNSAAEGIDNISMKLTKSIAPFVAKFFADTINASMRSGHVPNDFKIAKITPIHKQGKKSDPQNYRPISQLPIIAKCEEKIVNKQMLEFLENHKLINPYQYGFRQKSNTESAIFDLSNDISEKVDSGRKVALMLFDQMKAFDTAHHKTLITKLFNNGIKGKENKWFQSYLDNRKQYVQVEETKSNICSINCGIPQGSATSGTSYIIYNNDIKDLTLNGTAYLYADDLALVVTAETYEELELKINTDLNCIAKYLEANKSTLNAKKSKFMIFKDASPPKLLIKLNDIEIQQVKSAIHLGVSIDFDMKWKSQTEIMRKKLAPVAGVFRKISKSIPFEMKKKIFFSMFQSKLLYGITAWGCADEEQIKSIQKIQNKAIKNLFNLPHRTPTKKIHSRFEILTVKQLHQKSAATHIYKIANQLIHSNITLQTGSEIHQHQTKNSATFRKPKRKSKYFGSSSSTHKSITAFNALPEKLRKTKKFNEFKNELKIFLFQQ
jgi:endonuclease/exonuclease/phosphatase (EEP) superfamily protein YafD